MISTKNFRASLSRWDLRLIDYRFLSIIILLITLSSCTDDLGKTSSSYESENKNFEISVSNHSFPSNFGNTDNFETRIKSMSVLVFLPKDKNNETNYPEDLEFYKQAKVDQVFNYNPDTKSTSFKIALQVPLNTPKATLLFLANTSKIADESLLKGTSLAQIIEQLEFSTLYESGPEAGTYRWDMKKESTLNDGSLRMHSQVDLNIRELAPAVKLKINLSRSVARVDFGFRYSIDNQGNELITNNGHIFDGKSYEIRSIHAYGLPKKGYTAAKRTKTVDTESNIISENHDMYEMHANTTENVPNITHSNPYIFKLIGDNSGVSHPIRQKLYLPATQVGEWSKGKENGTYFVLGIKNEDYTTPDKVRYFLVNPSLNNGFTRNKRYIISIDEIKGNDYRTPEEALKGEAYLNTTVTLADWDLQEVSEPGTGSVPYFSWEAKPFTWNANSTDIESRILTYFNIGKFIKLENTPEGFTVKAQNIKSSKLLIIINPIGPNTTGQPIRKQVKLCFQKEGNGAKTYISVDLVHFSTPEK